MAAGYCAGLIAQDTLTLELQRFLARPPLALISAMPAAILRNTIGAGAPTLGDAERCAERGRPAALA